MLADIDSGTAVVIAAALGLAGVIYSQVSQGRKTRSKVEEVRTEQQDVKEALHDGNGGIPVGKAVYDLTQIVKEQGRTLEIVSGETHDQGAQIEALHDKVAGIDDKVDAVQIMQTEHLESIAERASDWDEHMKPRLEHLMAESERKENEG